jgi:polar amino acid transport system substrate-binding protein
MAAQQGEEPYWKKDLKTGEWSGFGIEFGKDIAKEMGVKLEVFESTSGQSVLDLLANKIDISFALTPTPRRMLSIDFTRPLFYNVHLIVAAPDFKKGKTWEELNDPKVTIAVDLGSTHEMFARRYAPNAKILAYKTFDECIMALQSKRADCFVNTVFKALATLKKNPGIGKIIIPKPLNAGPTCAGVQRDQDKLFRDFVSNWADFNRGLGNIQEWIIKALGDMGIKASAIPSEFQF